MCPVGRHEHTERCNAVRTSLSRIVTVVLEFKRKFEADRGLAKTLPDSKPLTHNNRPCTIGQARSHKLARNTGSQQEIDDDAANPAAVERSMYTMLADLHECAIVAATARNAAADGADAVNTAARDAAARDALVLANRARTALRLLKEHVPNAALVEMTTLLGELVRPFFPAMFPDYCCNLSHKGLHFQWANTDDSVSARRTVWHKVRLVHAVHTEEALASVLSLVDNEDGKVVLRATLKSREPPPKPLCCRLLPWAVCVVWLPAKRAQRKGDASQAELDELSLRQLGVYCHVAFS